MNESTQATDARISSFERMFIGHGTALSDGNKPIKEVDDKVANLENEIKALKAFQASAPSTASTAGGSSRAFFDADGAKASRLNLSNQDPFQKNRRWIGTFPRLLFARERRAHYDNIGVPQLPADLAREIIPISPRTSKSYSLDFSSELVAYRFSVAILAQVTIRLKRAGPKCPRTGRTLVHLHTLPSHPLPVLPRWLGAARSASLVEWTPRHFLGPPCAPRMLAPCRRAEECSGWRRRSSRLQLRRLPRLGWRPRRRAHLLPPPMPLSTRPRRLALRRAWLPCRWVLMLLPLAPPGLPARAWTSTSWRGRLFRATQALRRPPRSPAAHRAVSGRCRAPRADHAPDAGEHAGARCRCTGYRWRGPEPSAFVRVSGGSVEGDARHGILSRGQPSLGTIGYMLG